MILRDDQLDRYARHIVLKEIGGEGQRKLLDATVLIVGAGGIGSPVVLYLAAAGVGNLIIHDDDRVSLANLQRQVLFWTKDVGRLKVQAACQVAEGLNRDVRATPEFDRFPPLALDRKALAGVDVIVDGSDTFPSRLAVADAALALRIPLVSAAVAQFDGQLALFRGWEPDKPCYRCFVGSDPGLPEQSCAEQGVLGPMAGVMGSLAAMEAIRAITGFGEDSAGKLLRVDGLSLRFRTSVLAKDPGCRSCRG